MLLRRLSEKYPALICGAPSLQTPFSEFAAQLGAELARLKNRPCRIETDKVWMQRFLFALPETRRLAVLCGSPMTAADWERVGAIALAELLAGRRFPVQKEAFDREVDDWLRLGIARGEGPAQFVRAVLSGKGGDVRLLTQPLEVAGATLINFIARGSTSCVWRAQWRGRDAVLKLPIPGAEERFCREFALRSVLPPHPGIAELAARSRDREDAYCILEYCRSGNAAELAAKRADFADALDFLHRHGIVHGDIRRSNLGLRADGSAALFDFSHATRAVGAALERAAKKEQNLLQLLLLQGEKNERGVVSGDVPRAGQAVA
jgi:hypothetical protein